MSAVRRDHIREMLADLKLPGALEAVDDILAEVDRGSVTAGEAVERLLGAQISLRNNRRLQTAMRSSRLPAIKTIGQFDFAFQPSIQREQLESLHELGFVKRRENVIFLGPPGVGKTHLAIPSPSLPPSLAVASTTELWSISSSRWNKLEQPVSSPPAAPRPESSSIIGGR